MTALNSGYAGAITSVSCTSAGNCGATGYYGVGLRGQKTYYIEVFVVSQVNGTWGQAIEVPGTAALNMGQWAGTDPGLSCAAPGRCSAGGDYTPYRAEVDAWLGRYRALWEQRLDALHTEVARGRHERRSSK